ncbi:MAG: DUF1287 domain-containing protein [Fimbriimonadales bacterium]
MDAGARLGWLVALAALVAGCHAPRPSAGAAPAGPKARVSPNAVVEGALAQLDWGTRYDARYTDIAYPNGDVPKTQGVCTDVVVRAMRHAGYDLQQLVHEDKRRDPRAYPRYPGPKIDSNIDHRRCPNLAAFFTRHGVALPVDGDWLPGDVVFWKLDSGRDHVGVVSDRRGPSGEWMVVHNIATVEEADCLHQWKVVGHFRYPRPSRDRQG